MLAHLKSTPAWKKYTTAGGGGGDLYELCSNYGKSFFKILKPGQLFVCKYSTESVCFPRRVVDILWCCSFCKISPILVYCDPFLLLPPVNRNWTRLVEITCQQLWIISWKLRLAFMDFFCVIRVADLKVVIMVNGNEVSDDNYISTASYPWRSVHGSGILAFSLPLLVQKQRSHKFPLTSAIDKHK